MHSYLGEKDVTNSKVKWEHFECIIEKGVPTSLASEWFPEEVIGKILKTIKEIDFEF